MTIQDVTKQNRVNVRPNGNQQRGCEVSMRTLDLQSALVVPPNIYETRHHNAHPTESIRAKGKNKPSRIQQIHALPRLSKALRCAPDDETNVARHCVAKNRQEWR